MKQNRLADLMQHEIDTARALIEKEGAEVINHFIGDSDEGVYYVMSPWTNSQERALTLAAVRQLFYEKKVKRYLHVSEAWCGEDPNIQPSKDPARQECFVIVAVDTAAGVRRVRFFPIERLADGGRLLGDEEEEKQAELEGDSFNLLDPNPALN
jgi:hypothetical protein